MWVGFNEGLRGVGDGLGGLGVSCALDQRPTLWATVCSGDIEPSRSLSLSQSLLLQQLSKQYQTHSIDTILLLTIYQKNICDDENEHSFYALAMHSWFVHRQESWCKDSPGWLNLPKVGWTTTLPDLSKVGWTSTRSFQGWLNYASWLNYYPLFGAELDKGVLSMWCPLPSLTILTI